MGAGCPNINMKLCEHERCIVCRAAEPPQAAQVVPGEPDVTKAIQLLSNMPASAAASLSRDWLGNALIAAPAGHTEEFLLAADTIWQAENAGLQHVEDVPGTRWTLDGTRLLLYRGDITKLHGVHAIVNAANDQGEGCFVPAHRCIDNVIHRAAGPRLREECSRAMQARGCPLSAGTAPLVTQAYHLPVTHVLHVTGPQMPKGTRPTAKAQAQLRSCYEGCLDAAREHGIRSVAFNCISTGLFGYPQEDAAQLAMETVAGWIRNNPGMMELIVFDVFMAEDQKIYSTFGPQFFSPANSQEDGAEAEHKKTNTQ